MSKEVIEVCDYCNHENVFENVNTDEMVRRCEECGRWIVLCDKCVMHDSYCRECVWQSVANMLNNTNASTFMGD